MDCKTSTGFNDIPDKLLAMGSAPLARPICSLIYMMFICNHDIVKYVAAFYKDSDNLNKENNEPHSFIKIIWKSVGYSSHPNSNLCLQYFYPVLRLNLGAKPFCWKIS